MVVLSAKLRGVFKRVLPDHRDGRLYFRFLERNYARCAGGAPPASPFHAQRVGNAGGELNGTECAVSLVFAWPTADAVAHA